MKTIDDIFKSGETEKRLTIEPGVWHRIDRELNLKRNKDRIVKMRITLMSVAAVGGLLIATMFVFNPTKRYTVEDLQNQDHPTLSAEIISHLHDLPIINRYSDI